MSYTDSVSRELRQGNNSLIQREHKGTEQTAVFYWGITFSQLYFPLQTLHTPAIPNESQAAGLRFLLKYYFKKTS